MDKKEKNITNSIHQIRIPMVVSLSLALGIFIGSAFFGTNPGAWQMAASMNKFREVLGIIQNDYVDTINTNKITELAIGQMLEKLDPHSSYIPSSDVDLSNASLESNFEGVGIEFLIVNDTIQVISAIQGGPSDVVGIMAGDRLVSTDGAPLIGSNLTNKEVFKRLRGSAGSQVEIGIIRPGMKELQKFLVTRSTISSQSIEASYQLKPGIGYIKISRFSDNTFLECEEKLLQLQKQGAKSFILDLRDNPGGYLDRATRLANEFLPDNRLMVFTEGQAKKYNQKYTSNGKGRFQESPLLILVNEGSASAAEILAGAIQDNDRGLIIGRRTYGKGLVQVPLSLKDGSELRLTISRYYTPSGRCIQKPYNEKNSNYENDLEMRFRRGEYFSKDSMKIEKSEEFQTDLGRKVYGGGGILPDVFVPLDSQNTNQFLLDIMKKNLFRDFAIGYYKDHETELNLLKKRTDAQSFELTSDAWPRFVELTHSKKIEWPIRRQTIESEKFLTHLMKAYLARLLWGDNGFFMVINQKDPVILSGLNHLPDAQKLLLASKTKKLP